MFRLRGLGCGALACLSLAAACPGSAWAADVAATCTTSYESAQISKKKKEYQSARRELLACIRTCPAVVQRECGQWLDALEPVVPSIVIHAEAAGEDRSEVKVEMDGKMLAERLDGKGIDVDPGRHDFVFSLEGYPPIRKTVLVQDGEQLRVLNAAFEKPDAGGSSGRKAAVTSRPVPVATYVLGGIALAGGAAFAAFGLVGNSQRNRLETECMPHCSDGQVDGLRRNMIVADVSLGVGLAALATSTVIWLARPSVPSPRGTPEGVVDAQRPLVSIAPTRTGASFSATLTFQ